MCNFCSIFGTPRKRVPSEFTFAPCGAYADKRIFFEKTDYSPMYRDTL